MDLNAGLMALANFGTGYQQGQRNAVSDQMQKIGLANAIQQQQQNQQNLNYQRLESDNMMKAFLPKIAGPAQPGKPDNGSTQPNNQAPGQTNEPQFGTPDWFMQQGKFAASIGDMTHATEMATNATNATLAQYSQAQKASAIQTAELKRQAESYKNVANILGDPTINSSANPAQEFHQRLLAVLNDPNVSPEEKRNLQGLQYSPQIVDKLGQTGVSAAQKAEMALRQAQFSATEQQRHVQNNLAQQRLLAEQAHWVAQERDKTANAKIGKGGQAVTSAEHLMATPIVQQIMGSSFDPNDPNSNLAIDTIASRAKQMVNRPGSNLNFSQALSIAAQAAKQKGEFKTTTVPAHHILGMDFGSKETTKFDTQEGTQENPIPLEGLTSGDLQKGKWYVKDGKVEQYNP